jgi:hypothetical protein
MAVCYSCEEENLVRAKFCLECGVLLEADSDPPTEGRKFVVCCSSTSSSSPLVLTAWIPRIRRCLRDCELIRRCPDNDVLRWWLNEK